MQALLTKWQAQTGMPVPEGGHKTLAELSAEWAAEDANMTDEELVADRAFWEEYETAIINKSWSLDLGNYGELPAYRA